MNDIDRTATSDARRGGRLVADSLLAQGIDLGFTVPGESFLGTLDGLRDVSGRFRLITTRIEIGAAQMAESVGKLTGRPAAAFVTRGPGACHAAIGVHVAAQDSTPMLLFIGQIPRAETDRDSFQEIDYRRMFGGIAKFVTQIDDAARVPELIAHAVDVATSGRPGPAVLALSEEMQMETATVPDLPASRTVRPFPDPGAVAEVAARLSRAERPLVILGGSCWREDPLARLGAWLRAAELPVTVGFRRQSVYAGAHENYAGDLGVGADPALVKAAKEADLILAIGSRLGEATLQGYTLFDPAGATPIVQVLPDGAELGRVHRLALGIEADLSNFADALAALPAPAPRWREWTRRLRTLRDAARAIPDYPSPLNLGRLLRALESRLPADAVFTTDAGNFAGWPTRFMNLQEGQAFLGPTNGAMGYAVPAAVGASIAVPARTVVGFVGDGGFLMTGTELATAVQFGAAPVVMVFDNGMYGTIRMHQEREFPGRPIATDLVNPDLTALARALGAHVETIARDAEIEAGLDGALRAAREGRRPAVIHVVCDPKQLSSRKRLDG